jgi:hypothetical protein
MVTQSRTSARKRSNAKRLRYFYLNGDLHKVLRVTRPQDFVEAWNYREGKTMGYVWSDVKKRSTRALTMTEVGKLIGRHRVQIQNYILDGNIARPQRQYTLDEARKPGKYMFSEDDVMKLHEYLLTVHQGRPRKDGRITPTPLPTKAELRALMKHDFMTYVKVGEDEFIPAWKEPEW